MIKELALKFGNVKTTIITTIIIGFISFCLSCGIRTLFGYEINRYDMIIAIAIPFVITPLMSILYLKLILRIHFLEYEMNNMVNIDEITGFSSKHAYHENSFTLFNLALRNFKDFGIMYFEIDNYSDLEGTFGQGVCNYLLSQLGLKLNTEKRIGDIIGRIGDNKYSITLPETDNTGANYVAEKLRKEIEQMVFTYNKHHFSITISVGVSCRPVNQKIVLGDLYKIADMNLIKAKQSGQNRVVTSFN